MNSKPLVSILVPCYNHEVFLDDCLGSVLAQTYDNIELLICDDCSPDRSYEKICTYEDRLKKRFSRVIILRNETNMGVTKNINRMLRLAQGEFVKTIASDDAMAPDAIGAMADYLLRCPEVDVVVSNGILVSEDQRYPDYSCTEQIYPEIPDFSPEGFFVRTARCNRISAPAAMVRRSVYDRFGLYDETVKVEDYEFWLRILKDGKARFAFLDRELLYYRINANSMTSLKNNSGIARRRKLFHLSEIGTLKKYREYFQKEDYSDIVLMRILSERWLAIEYGLADWEKELHENWRKFDGWKALSTSKQLSLRLQSGKLTLKKILMGFLRKN